MLSLRKFQRLGEIVQSQVKLNISIQTASYSRRSDYKNANSSYKVVKSKVRVKDEAQLGYECDPNWELLAPKSNRFYFPGSIGPAWQNALTFLKADISLENLIDFNGKDEYKLNISGKLCPTLIRKNLHEIFPAPEVVSTDNLSIITLRYGLDREIEKGAKKFVLAAREICTRLRLEGYWADFMNPFSGKPFYSYASGKNLYKIDERFRGLGMKVEVDKECTVISSDEESTFSGSIFTNASSDIQILKSILDKQRKND